MSLSKPLNHAVVLCTFITSFVSFVCPTPPPCLPPVYLQALDVTHPATPRSVLAANPYTAAAVAPSQRRPAQQLTQGLVSSPAWRLCPLRMQSSSRNSRACGQGAACSGARGTCCLEEAGARCQHHGQRQAQAQVSRELPHVGRACCVSTCIMSAVQHGSNKVWQQLATPQLLTP
jgi:hypothetical protein